MLYVGSHLLFFFVRYIWRDYLLNIFQFLQMCSIGK